MSLQDNETQQTALTSLNLLFKKTAQYFMLRYKLLIYTLLKKGHVKISALAEDSNLSETRLYQIVDEVERLNKEEGVLDEKIQS